MSNYTHLHSPTEWVIKIAIETLLDRPKFVPPPSWTSVGLEGESLQVPLQAHGNPENIIYTWTKNGVPIPQDTSGSVSAGEHRIFADGAVLNFTKLHRDDAGIYLCTASNSQGKASLNITVVVECK